MAGRYASSPQSAAYCGDYGCRYQCAGGYDPRRARGSGASGDRRPYAGSRRERGGRHVPDSRVRGCAAARAHGRLDGDDPWSALILQYPELLDATPLTPTEVIDLYRSHVREWDEFPEVLQIVRTAAL